MKRDVFQVMADPTRRSIQVLIASQAMTPHGLSEHFASTRQGVSKQDICRTVDGRDAMVNSGMEYLLTTSFNQLIKY